LRGGFYRTFPQFLGQLPIRLVDFGNPAEKKLHDDLVALVDVMLALHKKRSPFYKKGVGGDFEGDQLQRQIEKTDREINDLVYKLYSVSDTERAIIEQRR
jgi:hypothetical protein